MKVYTNVEFYAKFLELEGWNIFSTHYDKENEIYTFGCDYIKNDGKYDDTTSYDIRVIPVRTGNYCINYLKR